MSESSLESRVAVVETRVDLMHRDFTDLRSTITNAAMSVTCAVLMGMIGVVVYFGQQKDEALQDVIRAINTRPAVVTNQQQPNLSQEK
jgi:ATP adenylyltransferase/5',5'''-P-1,P-4-tetraphosphate phosphorylase II